MKDSAIDMKKVAGLAIAAVLFLTLVSGGVWAYLSDSRQSTNNTLAAGTLALLTNNAQGVTQTVASSGLKPGKTIGPSTVILKNAGTLNASSLGVAFAYTESDETVNPGVNMTANQVGAILQVTAISYDGSDLLPSVSDWNANGYKDVEDLTHANLTSLSGILANTSKNFVLTIQMRSSAGNDFRGDGINMTMTFTLNQ